MRNYTITLQGKEINITQNDDGTFNKPDFILELEKQGTATKPAHEPICMARKPLAEKTVAENVLKYGTGGINIDESRVEYTDGTTAEQIKRKYTGNNEGNDSVTNNFGVKDIKMTSDSTLIGRFPANLIHDNSEEVRECFPDSGGGKAKHNSEIVRKGMAQDGSSFNAETCGFDVNKCQGMANFGDSGNASRFFKSIIYQAKASKAERNRGCEGLEEKIGGSMCANTGNTMDLGGASLKGEKKQIQNTKNNHPTVKPIALMEYLIKMVTPKGGIVLDPFAGSGSTLVAAKQNGFQYIGIELTEEYIPIIEARLNALNQDKLL